MKKKSQTIKLKHKVKKVFPYGDVLVPNIHLMKKKEQKIMYFILINLFAILFSLVLSYMGMKSIYPLDRNQYLYTIIGCMVTFASNLMYFIYLNEVKE